MIQQPYRQFQSFFKEHTGSEWQQFFARTSIFATLVVFALATVIMLLVIFASNNIYAREIIPYMATATLLSASLYYLMSKPRWAHLGGVGLIFLYLALGASLVHCVSIGPASIILFSVAVVFTGFLYGFWCSLVPAALSTSILMGFKASGVSPVLQQAPALFPRLNTFTAILIIVLILYIFAAIGGTLHYYLSQAQKKLIAVEKHFTYQRNLLKREIQTTHEQLRASETEKIEQLYRFAAIGEISSALMHDLATSLSTLSLEIDDLASEKSNQAIGRARTKLQQINDLLRHTRQQIRGHSDVELFDIVEELDQTIESLQAIARKQRVTIRWVKPAAPLQCVGERILLRQSLTNLIKNAIDSYDAPAVRVSSKPVVDVTVQSKPKQVEIRIIDYGHGIPKPDRQKIFEPFYSTKKDGMGMGLYLTKRFIETNLNGSLKLRSTDQQTVFIIELPKSSSQDTLTSK